MANEYYIVSNYFKTIKLLYEDIKAIKTIPLGRLQIVTFTLKGKSSFGNKIIFLGSKQLWDMFCDKHPEVKSSLDKKTV